MSYKAFFKKATGFHPYPYQASFAEEPELRTLLRIPTGAGKTEAAALGWLYRRFQHPDPAVRAATPRRLVYCLPTRSLVEQTVKRVEGWLERLNLKGGVGVVTLMGGEPRDRWSLKPERPCVIIGVQDMLLSRALNRGYGNSPFAWPVEYGLLNNDCLWVMDEAQLMANGLPTSTQLAGLREKLSTYGPAGSVWMSATARPDWLGAFDHPAPTGDRVLELGDDDLADPRLSKRHRAQKIAREESVDVKKPKEMAKLIASRHQPGALTLAIVNTVDRAQKVYAEVKKASPDAEAVLVHSRFRECDRREKNNRISKAPNPSGLIVVATQAVEAGVDISARTLITELAPWASLVQRFGRCNRKGEYKKGDVLWIDVGEKDAAPYEAEDMKRAREIMRGREGHSVGPSDLEALSDAVGDADHLTVIRRRDVVGLFDTTPDLSGSYLDVSQYVRGTDENDVLAFWRDVAPEGPNKDTPKPRHRETVRVPLGDFKGSSKGRKGYLGDDKRKAWRWDFLDREWRRVQASDIHPGMTLLLDAEQGWYSPDTGWDPSSKDTVSIPEKRSEPSEPEEGYESEDTNTGRKGWVTLADHSRHVESETKDILDALSESISDPDIREAVKQAAQRHDAGKAHSAFQEMLRKGEGGSGKAPGKDELMAKSPLRERSGGGYGPDRRHFRHELGSALAVLKHSTLPEGRVRDLAAYLAMAHHGRVRLSVRSLPGRRAGGKDSNPDPDLLLGYRVLEPEVLPPVDLGNGLLIPETELDMTISHVGLGDGERRSWMDRSLGLLKWLGPFRLAYLEAIVRAADWRASAKEEGSCD